MSNYAEMSVEALQEALARNAEARAALKVEAQAIHAELDRKQATRAAQERVAGMSDVEKAAVLEALRGG